MLKKQSLFKTTTENVCVLKSFIHSPSKKNFQPQNTLYLYTLASIPYFQYNLKQNPSPHIQHLLGVPLRKTSGRAIRFNLFWPKKRAKKGFPLLSLTQTTTNHQPFFYSQQNCFA
ncbi:hypothetical protein B0A77_03910 [Flavobacterium branchiophilum]|uniref:Uncharacterized protein n=1 Tax=Flavobacterium branchiophilum TaxID=55197 RepID=A0A2H3L074_9FLAO|nr:hypothetical protein B0A77_03910 [Flavobacterium branchiophilum]